MPIVKPSVPFCFIMKPEILLCTIITHYRPPGTNEQQTSACPEDHPQDLAHIHPSPRSILVLCLLLQNNKTIIDGKATHLSCILMFVVYEYDTLCFLFCMLLHIM